MDPLSVPGTHGCWFSGLCAYGALGSCDREVPGGSEAFGSLCGPWIPLQLFSCSHTLPVVA